MEYKELMLGLADLPGQIAQAESEVADLRKFIKDAKTALDNREVDIIASRDAKAWGSNAEDRKNAQSLVFRSDDSHRRLTGQIASAEHDLAKMVIDVDRLKTTFYAFRTMAELSAAYMLGGRSVASNGNGQYIASAAELGL